MTTEPLVKTEPPAPLPRIFIADGREFPDPDPNLTIDQVRLMLADFMSELHNCKIEEADKGNIHYVTFLKTVGVKG